ncbi:hypothetical protein BH11BAC2_BH11BAC2_08830 [soil metagenome]
MSRFNLILLFVLLSFHLFGGPPDENVKKKIAPYFLLDTYYSFIGDRGADVWGFKVGIEWKEQWRLALGFNKIKSDIVEYKALPQDEIEHAINDTVKAQLYLRYYPVMAEYVFYDHDPWQLSAPLCLGYGRSYFQYFDKENKTRNFFNHGVLISDVGVNAQYKILKWVGLGAGIGYRIMLVNNPEVSTDFSSPLFSIRIKLFLGEIVHSLLPHAKFPE